MNVIQLDREQVRILHELAHSDPLVHGLRLETNGDGGDDLRVALLGDDGETVVRVMVYEGKHKP